VRQKSVGVTGDRHTCPEWLAQLLQPLAVCCQSALWGGAAGKPLARDFSTLTESQIEDRTPTGWVGQPKRGRRVQGKKEFQGPPAPARGAETAAQSAAEGAWPLVQGPTRPDWLTKRGSCVVVERGQGEILGNPATAARLAERMNLKHCPLSLAHCPSLSCPASKAEWPPQSPSAVPLRPLPGHSTGRHRLKPRSLHLKSRHINHTFRLLDQGIGPRRRKTLCLLEAPGVGPCRTAADMGRRSVKALGPRKTGLDVAPS
jgi:hypothetical protein